MIIRDPEFDMIFSLPQNLRELSLREAQQNKVLMPHGSRL